ncbi:MAG: hypothetical protein R2711_12200 [Acidimicrobiales bacterium]
MVRSGRAHQAAYAVAGYIAAAYWFTSSTSFANPAITIGRALTDTFAGIAPASVPAFVAAQAVGGTLALLLAGFTFHQPQGTELVVDHLEPTRGGPRDRSHPHVVFLCVHNAGRSQMALGFLRHLAGDRAEAWSGGSEPASSVNPVAVAAMAEVGIDIAGAQPQRWTEDGLRAPMWS